MEQLPENMQSQARAVIRGLVLSLEEEAARQENDVA
ncbi:Prophage PSPPH05, DNA-binding protein [Pseudomonas savastanoi pv. glycinea]|nr:Prophage PSPPH05, DNA-binding protein [Pseudomonas savastanoi pv. glycinea]